METGGGGLWENGFSCTDNDMNPDWTKWRACLAQLDETQITALLREAGGPGVGDLIAFTQDNKARTILTQPIVDQKGLLLQWFDELQVGDKRFESTKFYLGFEAWKLASPKEFQHWADTHHRGVYIGQNGFSGI